MKKSKLTLIGLLFLILSSCGSQHDLIATYNPFSKYELETPVYVFDEPAGARRLFRTNKKVALDYLNYVSAQSPSWYLKYFNVNTMRKMGWSSHWDFYNNRFFVWQSLINNPQLWIGEKWNVPINSEATFFAFSSPQNDLRRMLQRLFWLENYAYVSFNASMQNNIQAPLSSNNTDFNTESQLKKTAKSKDLNSVIDLFQQNNIQINVVESVQGAIQLNALQKNKSGRNNATKGSYNLTNGVTTKNTTNYRSKSGKNNFSSGFTTRNSVNNNSVRTPISNPGMSVGGNSGGGGSISLGSGSGSKGSSGKKQ